MQITNVEATTHEIPIDVPLRDEVRRRRIGFVTVETDEGLTGYGQTGGYWWRAVREFINQEMGPVLEGMNPVETEHVWDQMKQALNPRVQTGVWSSAMSAVDIALWDLKGKQMDEPVWRLLGGASDSVPAYITFGLKTFDHDQLAEVAQDFVSQGEDKLKMKVAVDKDQGEKDNSVSDLAQSQPTPDLNEDARRIETVREAVGEDIELMIDANFELSLPEALELCRQIEQYGITWFEEPVYGNDAGLLADLRSRTSIPIAAGQAEGHRFRHRELIAEGAVDISQPNVCYVGGFTEGKKVASMAQAYNINIANGGGWPHHNMHLQAAMANGWRVEFHHMHRELGEMIYDSPPEPDGGTVTLTEDPGLGLEPDHDALAEHEVV